MDNEKQREEQFGNYVREKVMRVMGYLNDREGRPEWMSMNEGFLADLNVLTNIIATGLCLVSEKQEAMKLLERVRSGIEMIVEEHHSNKEVSHAN